jgi:cholesterol transport system auxiliary component
MKHLGVKHLGALLMCMALNGCSGFFESKLPPMSVYVLSAAPAQSPAEGVVAAPVDLAIGHPLVAPGLDTQRIASLTGNELKYYEGVSWGATNADVVQRMLIDSFLNQGLFRSVATEDSRLSSEYMLDVEVTAFQAEYIGNTAPTIRVALTGRIVRIKDRRMLATIPVEATQVASENRQGAVVAAFQAASRQVAVTLAQKTAAQIVGTHGDT